MTDALVRQTILFRGEVQGVGFRYTALQVSAGFLVAGFVRNLPNGQVEMVVEGKRESVDAFVNALAFRMRTHIHETTIESAAPTGEFDAFNIRR
ncbi:acylphosphatase [bacterium]|jgi:acylphosphatase|nr:acylphosphatase [bacterium]